MSYSQFNFSPKKIYDSLERKKTLSHGKYSFCYLENKYFTSKKADFKPIPQNILFLGLGYNANTDAIPFINNADQKIYFHEFSNFSEACKQENILCDRPKNFIELSKDDVFKFLANDNDIFSNWEVIIFQQNLTLFPRYWYNFLAELEELFYNYGSNLAEKKQSYNFAKNVFIAGSSKDLMFKEICQATQDLGLEALTILSEEKNHYQVLSDLLRSKKPRFFLSVNGRNLDSYGQVYALLKKLNIPTILWIVDNPWNILSGFKELWWQECQIYLTDHSFIPSLKSCGAKYVFHLPLAASTFKCRPQEVVCRELLYVGHSAFRNKNKFFASQSNEDSYIEQYKQIIEKYLTSPNNKLINYHDFYNIFHSKQGVLNKYFWLENEFRQVSFISHELDIYHKTKWLDHFYSKMSLIGDQNWNHILTNTPEIIAPVDYYNVLPNYYKTAKFTLNITSLLMPSALTQRHFDVWQNKGFLFTTSSDGLTIFPKNLSKEIIVSNPKNLEEKIVFFNSNHNFYNEVKLEFQNIILEKHLYRHRISLILQNC